MRGIGLQDFAQGYKKEERSGSTRKAKKQLFILGMTEKGTWQHFAIILCIYQHGSANSFQAQ